MHGYPQWRWHLDEVFVKVNGKLCYLWRAVDHEGEVLESVVTAKRDKVAAVKLLKRIMKKYGRPRKIVTDRLRAYSAAMREVGNADRGVAEHGTEAAQERIPRGRPASDVRPGLNSPRRRWRQQPEHQAARDLSSSARLTASAAGPGRGELHWKKPSPYPTRPPHCA